MKNVEQFYDSVNQIWKDNLTKDYHVGLYQTESDTIIEAQKNVIYNIQDTLSIMKGDTLLDVGCGTGSAAYTISSRTGCQIIGINISKKQLKDCLEYQKKLKEKLAFFQMDAINMKFPENIFDGIYALESIMHMERQKVLKNVHKCLKENKKFVFTDWYVRTPLDEKEKDLIIRLVQGKYISLDEYEQMLTQEKFREIEIEDWSDQILPTYEEWAPGEKLLKAYPELAKDINELICIAKQKLGYCKIAARK